VARASFHFSASRRDDVTCRLAPSLVDAELRMAEVSIEDIGCALASLYGDRALFDAEHEKRVPGASVVCRGEASRRA